MISVVIPVYNGEKTLRRVVDSVLAQLNAQVELILVDDGSVDGSGRICDEYSRSNPHIRVVHQANGGLSVARNTGIRAATGEYMMFLDADDYFAPDACEQVAEAIRKHHPDCIDFGFNYVNRTGEMTAKHHKIPKNVLLDHKVLREMILPPLLHLCPHNEYFVFEFACMKVFNRQIIMENDIFFDEGRRIWEDRSFIIHYLKYCRNYYSIDRCLYHYVYMEGSLGQRYTPDYFRIMLVSFRQYSRLYGDEFDFDTQYVNDYWSEAIGDMIYRSLEQTENTHEIRQTILTTLKDAQVIHWYANRKPQNAFEKRVSDLVVAGDAEAALEAYRKNGARRQWEQRRLQRKNRIKYAVYQFLVKCRRR